MSVCADWCPQVSFFFFHILSRYLRLWAWLGHDQDEQSVSVMVGFYPRSTAGRPVTSGGDVSAGKQSL